MSPVDDTPACPECTQVRLAYAGLAKVALDIIRSCRLAGQITKLQRAYQFAREVESGRGALDSEPCDACETVTVTVRACKACRARRATGAQG